MFRHQGKTRTLQHNLQIASLLSFIAGLVNVVGFLAVQKLTTNVTGHFAYIMEELLKENSSQAIVYALYIFAFFLGSFISNLMIEFVSRKTERYMYLTPVITECLLLLYFGSWNAEQMNRHPDLLAFSLLFAMGLQNSLVTTISNANVRTTHLTGLFTDLGIELSQLFFFTHLKQRHRLVSSIRLRLTIILFFFLGGMAGGWGYGYTGLHMLSFAGVLLIAGLLYDSIQFRLTLLRRRNSIQQHRKKNTA
jgi:uncharacterized membrane protein YoaK (UPF0700 family)